MKNENFIKTHKDHSSRNKVLYQERGFAVIKKLNPEKQEHMNEMIDSAIMADAIIVNRKMIEYLGVHSAFLFAYLKDRVPKNKKIIFDGNKIKRQTGMPFNDQIKALKNLQEYNLLTKVEIKK